MFYFKVDNAECRVTFRRLKTGYTFAFFQVLEPAGFVTAETASALCSPQDQFCKETGRKLALQRLLSEVFQDRDKRKLVWQAYFARKQKPISESEPEGC